MKFLILVIDSKWNSGTPSEIDEIDKFNDKLRDGGHWIFAWGLHGPEKSQLIDNRNGAGVIAAQSLVVTEENYSGFWLIEAQDETQAKELALEGSRACNRKVELRPLH